MSISAAHSSAARENGAHSHGPVSAEGKARSAQNARKHGLFATINLSNSEEKEQFSSLLQTYLEEYSPATLDEHRCVREMVNAEWRLAAIRRAVDIMQLHVAESMDAPEESRQSLAFQQLADSGQALSAALRYERHFQRQYDKALLQLLASRRASKTDREAIARRTDEAMANILRSVVEAPLPPFPPLPNENVQNEPKQPPLNPTINPTINVKKAPDPPTPNLFRG